MTDFRTADGRVERDKDYPYTTSYMAHNAHRPGFQDRQPFEPNTLQKELMAMYDRTRERAALAQAEREASPHRFKAQGMRLPPGSKFAPSKEELVNRNNREGK